jgi:hypothetical protein
MDRFDSREDAPDWASEQFEAGRRARLADAARESAPLASEIGEFGRKSWLAGWDDTEMGILSGAEIALQNGLITDIDDAMIDAITRNADKD